MPYHTRPQQSNVINSFGFYKLPLSYSGRNRDNCPEQRRLLIVNNHQHTHRLIGFVDDFPAFIGGNVD